jgi:hypothetical protein
MTDQSLVSWQSAFWALVPLALNSMLQPSGPKATYGGIGSLALRASPIICATDALTSVIQVIWLTKYENFPVRRAAKTWVLARSEATLAQETSVEALQWVRLLMFIVGTLSQSVKLFACRGISWTQAWGYLYVTSYAIFAILEFLATTGNDTHFHDKPIYENGSYLIESQVWDFSEFMMKTAKCAHAGFVVWALVEAVPRLIHIENCSSMTWWLWILSFPALILYVMVFQMIAAFMFMMEFATMFGGHSICYTALTVDLFINSLPKYLNICWQCVELAFFSFVALAVLRLLAEWLSPRYVLARRIEFGIRSLFDDGSHKIGKKKDLILPCTPIVGTSSAKEQEKTLAFIVILYTFGAGLLWYSRKYDPSHTFKPGWTNNLG